MLLTFRIKGFIVYLFRWYRAPELLYGARLYDEGVDLRAVSLLEEETEPSFYMTL